MAASTKKKATTAKAVPARQIYVGPNLGTNIPISQFTVFKGGLPPHIEERAKGDPDFKKLFVPVADLDRARAELRNPASVLARAFVAVVKKQGGE